MQQIKRQGYSLYRVLLLCIGTLAVAANTSSAVALVSSPLSTTYNPDEDVMTSSFFFGNDRVRGYTGDNRDVHRVSTDAPFGTPGAETLYINFSSTDFSGYVGTVSALLTVQSISGGFNADADSINPFTVSAHALDADPLSSITDDTNPGGTINWLDFYNNNILAADTAAHTNIDGFGAYNFDVSEIVNNWISGVNSIQSLALTGKNDSSGNDFLHGFLNNSEFSSSTYLTVTAVPAPAAIWLFASGLLGFFGLGRDKNKPRKSLLSPAFTLR